MASFDMTFVFQIVNTVLLIAVIYAIYRFVKNTASRLKKLDKIERDIETLKSRKANQ